MNIRFYFFTDNRQTAEKVIHILDQKDRSFEVPDQGRVIYALVRDFSYRCDKVTDWLKNTDAEAGLYRCGVLDRNTGNLWEFNAFEERFTRYLTNAGQNELPDMNTVYQAFKTFNAICDEDTDTIAMTEQELKEATR